MIVLDTDHVVVLRYPEHSTEPIKNNFRIWPTDSSHRSLGQRPVLTHNSVRESPPGLSRWRSDFALNGESSFCFASTELVSVEQRRRYTTRPTGESGAPPRQARWERGRWALSCIVQNPALHRHEAGGGRQMWVRTRATPPGYGESWPSARLTLVSPPHDGHLSQANPPELFFERFLISQVRSYSKLYRCRSPRSSICLPSTIGEASKPSSS